MRAGQLRHRISIERQTEDQDEYGAVRNEWVVLANVWASVEPLNGREFFASAQMQSQVTTRIRIRYFPGVTFADRVVYGNTRYRIQYIIDPQTRHEETVLMCVTMR